MVRLVDVADRHRRHPALVAHLVGEGRLEHAPVDRAAIGPGLAGRDVDEVGAGVGEGADLIDVSAGQTWTGQQPVYGRMFQTPFSDRIRNEGRLATMAVGNIYEPDHANSILAAGRADLVALARPHLANPNFTMIAAARYGVPLVAPKQYEPGAQQLARIERTAALELEELRLKARPKPAIPVIPARAAE